jgi:hypothetical protein
MGIMAILNYSFALRFSSASVNLAGTAATARPVESGDV